MHTNHNRIKVADLEKNEPNKILTTNNSGELEFSHINNIKTDIYNALDYIVAGKALDARQGKVLKDLIDDANELLTSDNTDLNTLQKLGDTIKVLHTSISTISNDLNNIKASNYNALDYIVPGKTLDARQGKVLKDLIDDANELLASDNADLNTLQKLGDSIKALRNSLSTILVNDLSTGGTTKALTAEMGKTLQSNKVDKVNGKSLLSDTEIARLGTLSNYTHPANHPASIINQDPGNRFVSDTEKVIWNAKQSFLGFTPENTADKNAANGYAGLGADGKLISSQLPSITVNDTFVIASEVAMLALTAETGDIAVRTDLSKSFILKGSNSAALADWQELLTPTSAVTTVFGRNGAITSQTGDYSTDQINETTTRKFQSANQQIFNDATSSIQTQLNSKVSSTGSGASGTWSINVTGNSNTVGGLPVHPDRNNEPNKIVRTDNLGYIQAGWINTISGNNGTNSINRIYASDDQYLRYYTPANFISTLGLATTASTIPSNLYSGTPVATYFTTNGSVSGLKIKLPFGTNSGKMVSFTVRLYQSYEAYDIQFSGYLYETIDNWYSPKALMICGTSPLNVIMGKDSDGKAYVWLSGGSYSGAAVFDVVGGYNTADWNTGWTITNDASAPNQALNTNVYPTINTNSYKNYSSFSGLVSSGTGFQTANYAVNTRNRVWSFGDADGYGLSYFQGSSGQYGTDSIGLHFGTATNAASKFIFASNGDLITTGLTTSSALGVAQTTGSGQGISLYAGAVNGMPSYGLMFATTSNYGGYGSVSGDWATYFTMAGATNRGWIFRSTSSNVASISATGVFTGSSFVGTLSGNADSSTLTSQLRWNNYGNGHTIFDASSSLSPSGTTVSNANAEIAWNSTYPSLMGWNGANTYGLRVDSARIADRSSRANGNFYIDDNYGNGVVGVYSSTRYQGIYAMGDAYKLAADGTATNNCYGLVWTHPNVGGQSIPGLSHQLLVMEAGGTKTAIGTGIWTSGSVTASRFAAGYDSGVANSFSCDGWFRSGGTSGWYNSTYGGGIWMQNSTNVEIYGNKQLLVNNNIMSTGDVIAYYSDERLKTKKGSITNALDKVAKLNGFYYENNDLAKSFGYKSDDLQLGLSAQEVQAVLPEIVTRAPFDREIMEDGTETSKSGENYLTVNYAKVVPLLIEAIKEQQSQIKYLLTKINK
ncbi:tail fiber domain-containing protein [Flavobacterium chilense]|uniref:Chaperone of endosialidase n=1 Tax=Flavobacterium chilense TaxID=946677 RepID=A0A1M7ET28_9FLAO|nr:tail fiber domain-containing protein [Flavobacterium chilense]SHL94748.1 Chaperone of endosialidase [Flavobacterium chilense]